jgi:hypothetical protein
LLLARSQAGISDILAVIVPAAEPWQNLAGLKHREAGFILFDDNCTSTIYVFAEADEVTNRCGGCLQTIHSGHVDGNNPAVKRMEFDGVAGHRPIGIHRVCR